MCVFQRALYSSVLFRCAFIFVSEACDVVFDTGSEGYGDRMCLPYPLALDMLADLDVSIDIPGLRRGSCLWCDSVGMN